MNIDCRLRRDHRSQPDHTPVTVAELKSCLDSFPDEAIVEIDRNTLVFHVPGDRDLYYLAEPSAKKA